MYSTLFVLDMKEYIQQTGGAEEFRPCTVFGKSAKGDDDDT